ncbi:hypothetical protein GGR53DRAFT_336270 [Hypoxylon sp. FL1150]|nr:hypothetical protein GGR53DRAFT_336270 [Hypoxylon sp. FL1150]
MALFERESHGNGLAPMEILYSDAMLEIIERLPDFESLMNFIQASPNAYRTLYPHQGLICHKLLIREFGPLLPIIVARLEASTVEWRPKRPSLWDSEQARHYSVKLGHFCDQYLSGQATKLGVPVSYFTYQRTHALLEFHKCVSEWAKGIAVRMIQQPVVADFTYSNTAYDRQINDRERHRVVKTLYVTELISMLLPQRFNLNIHLLDDDWLTFWKCFAPWEFCQYLEMQTVIFEFIRALAPLKHGLPSGRYLDELYTYMRGRSWIQLYEILVFQAGLEALKPALDAYLPGKPNPQPPSKLYEIIEDFIEYPEMRAQWCCRFNIQWRWRGNGRLRQIFPEYEQIWLKQASASGGDFVAYSFDTAHIEESYTDSDEGPLACWLYDISKYGRRHDGFRLRDDPNFLMTSFWDRARWHTAIDSKMPSMAELREDTSTKLLRDNGWVIPIPDE